MLRLFALCVLLGPVLALAHPGRTDSSGCHNDRKHGGYHCHDGVPSTSDSPSGGVPPARATAPVAAPQATPFLGQRLPDGGVYDPYAKPAQASAPPEKLPTVPADARPTRPPVDKVAAPTKPASAAASTENQTPAHAPGSAQDGAALLCFIFSITILPVGVYVWFRRARRPPGTAMHEAIEDDADVRVARRREPPRPGERGLTASRKGKCTECGRWFGAGTPIFWNASSRRARHVRCDEA